MNYSISKILVPLDLSETSLNALETAIAIAKRSNASIHLINVIEPKFDAYSDENTTYSFEISANSNDVLNALTGSIKYTHDVKPFLIQKQGIVYDAIIKTLLSEKIDLVVIGTHGASGFRNGFVGSNTYSVVKYAPCPVLCIPPKRKYLNFTKVVFPIRPVSGALSRYDIICHFLHSDSSIEVLGLSYKQTETDTNVLEKIVDEVRDKIDSDKIAAKTVWGTGSTVSDDVLQYTQQHVPDLIVLTNILDVAAKNNFIGPHAQKIINCAKVPFISIKDNLKLPQSL